MTPSRPAGAAVQGGRVDAAQAGEVVAGQVVRRRGGRRCSPRQKATVTTRRLSLTALIWEAFGGQDANESLRAAFTELVARPEHDDDSSRLLDWVMEMLEEDPAARAATAGMLTAYYRRQFEAGDAKAMPDLGDLLLSLNEQEPQQARAAYGPTTVGTL